MLRFLYPWWLLALLVIPLYLYYEQVFKRHRRRRLPFSNLAVLRQVSGRDRLWRWLLPIMRALLMLCLIIALSRPQWGTNIRDLDNKGVDIVIALDVSGSMLALDFKPQNRLIAAKQVAADFIRKRPNDRFGLVTFGSYALTVSPLTFDHNALLTRLNEVEINLDASATAIGMGLAKAVARLQNSSAKSKLIILITDGVNNTGEIDPISAAEMAKALDIRIYTIGVGSNEPVDFPDYDPFLGNRYKKVLIELDMETLDQIAAITGTGKAALATDTGQLDEVMSHIDRLEKTDFKINLRYRWKEQFMLFLWIAATLIALDLLLRLWWQPMFPSAN
ncbi:MAG: VWA domain-containing protein [Candidatus Cloacimonetes bacterium]|nr:VWA domain-containing protein [Candidatus Cloacimonadota bacterium]